MVIKKQVVAGSELSTSGPDEIPQVGGQLSAAKTQLRMDIRLPNSYNPSSGLLRLNWLGFGCLFRAYSPGSGGCMNGA
jgi:hypothetical protein